MVFGAKTDKTGTSFEEMKAEAVYRMNKLRIYDYTVRQFEEDGFISISEPPSGAYYWVEDDERVFIEFVEKEHNILIYTGMLSYMDIGKVVSYLYVSDKKDKWLDERKRLENWESTACVHYVDFPNVYEFGHVSFRQSAGGGLLCEE